MNGHLDSWTDSFAYDSYVFHGASVSNMVRLHAILLCFTGYYAADTPSYHGAYHASKLTHLHAKDAVSLVAYGGLTIVYLILSDGAMALRNCEVGSKCCRLQLIF